MAQFSGESVVTIQQLAIHHDTRSDAGTQCDDDEVLHAASYAIDHLADSGSIGIVGESYGDVV